MFGANSGAWGYTRIHVVDAVVVVWTCVGLVFWGGCWGGLDGCGIVGLGFAVVVGNVGECVEIVLLSSALCYSFALRGGFL